MHWERDHLELIPHCTSRDLNVMGLQSRLIGYWVNRIRNVLFITGDPPKMAPNLIRAPPLFSTSTPPLSFAMPTPFSMLDWTLAASRSARTATPDTHFTIGTGCEPEALNLQREWERLAHKIDAGADYVMTQPTFNHKAPSGLDHLSHPGADHCGGDGAAGVGTRPAHCRGARGSCAGKNFCKAGRVCGTQPTKPKRASKLAAEQVRQVRAEGWSGLYLMSPAGHQPVLEVLKRGLA